MGKVITKIKMTNYIDWAQKKNNTLSADKVRSCNVEVLVDTGATMLTISEDIADKLGITKDKEIYVKLADDSIHRYFKGRGVMIEIGDRDCVTDCVILEKGTQSLLGQIPLEEMDLVVDRKNQKLIANPDSYQGKTVVMLK